MRSKQEDLLAISRVLLPTTIHLIHIHIINDAQSSTYMMPSHLPLRIVLFNVTSSFLILIEFLGWSFDCRESCPVLKPHVRLFPLSCLCMLHLTKQLGLASPNQAPKCSCCQLAVKYSTKFLMVIGQGCRE